MTADAALMLLREQHMICKEFLERRSWDWARLPDFWDLRWTVLELERPQRPPEVVLGNTQEHKHTGICRHFFLKTQTMHDFISWHHPVLHHNDHQTHISCAHTHAQSKWPQHRIIGAGLGWLQTLMKHGAKDGGKWNNDKSRLDSVSNTKCMYVCMYMEG